MKPLPSSSKRCLTPILARIMSQLKFLFLARFYSPSICSCCMLRLYIMG